MQNVLIFHDLLRHYNRKISPRCMMKIDLRKAYDMVGGNCGRGFIGIWVSN